MLCCLPIVLCQSQQIETSKSELRIKSLSTIIWVNVIVLSNASLIELLRSFLTMVISITIIGALANCSLIELCLSFAPIYKGDNLISLVKGIIITHISRRAFVLVLCNMFLCMLYYVVLLHDCVQRQIQFYLRVK